LFFCYEGVLDLFSKIKIFIDKTAMTRINDLPIYPPERKSEPKIEKPNEGRLEVAIRNMRKTYVSPVIESVEKYLPPISSWSEKTKKLYEQTTPYFYDDDKTNITKAAFIVVGGMGGFLLGLKRGGRFKQAFYSILSVATTAAFCYPNQTIDIFRTGVEHSRVAWDRFKEPPTPKSFPSKDQTSKSHLMKDQKEK